MLKEILSINNYPYLKFTADHDFIDKLGRVFKTYGFVLLALIFIAAPLVSSTDYFVVHVLHFKAINKQSEFNLHKLFEKNHHFSLIYICLLGPILEETVFRLPLAFKRTPIALSIACAAFVFGVLSVKPKFLISIFGTLCTLGMEIALLVVVFFAVKRLLPAEIQLSDRTKKWLIVLSICLFGCMHIGNFTPLQWPIIWVYPLYVVPQLCMGWLITYVRLKNGFIWGIVLHCMINSVTMVFAFGNTQPQKVTTGKYFSTRAKADSDTSVKVTPKLKTK